MTFTFEYDDPVDGENDGQEDEDMGGFQKEYVVDSIEEGLAKLRLFAIGVTRKQWNYALLSVLDGVYTVTEKTFKPCYGELRPYEDDVIPAQKGTRGQDEHPGDLPHGFPKGNILAISANVFWPTYISYKKDEFFEKGIEFWTSQKSPFRLVTENGFELLKVGEEYQGYLFTNMHVPPTLLISFLMFMREFAQMGWNLRIKSFKDEGFSFDMSCLLSMFAVGSGEYVPNFSAYVLNGRQCSWPNFLQGVPFDLDGGFTMYDRSAYNRPDIHFLFGRGRRMGRITETGDLVKFITKAQTDPVSTEYATQTEKNDARPFYPDF